MVTLARIPLNWLRTSPQVRKRPADYVLARHCILTGLGTYHVRFRRHIDGKKKRCEPHRGGAVGRGHLFVFRNRRGDRVKLLFWDDDRYTILYKRLEAGTFETPKAVADQSCLELDTMQLAMLLSGVSKEVAPAPAAVVNAHFG